MRAEEFGDRLRRGAADVAAQADPAPAGAVRRRGDRRRQHTMLASGVLAFAIGAGGGGYAYASFTTPTGSNAVSSGTSQVRVPADAGRPAIVAVSTGGVVELLNSRTGEATATLTGTQDAVGDEVAVSPDGSTAYFAVHTKGSCTDEIQSVPLSGGTPSAVAVGVLPAMSPNGTELAFVREQFGGVVTPVQFGCDKGASVQVVVLNLDRHAATTYPAPPGEAPFVAPISHLSWSPDGSMLLVSSGPVQDNEGWELNRLNVTKSAYYLPDGSKETGKRYVQAATSASAGSYFEEGVYLRDGNLFVDRMCCAGEPPKTTSSLLQVVNGSGGLVRAVAIGYLKDAHSSLDAVPGWTLYLSGTDLFIVADGQKAKALTTGYIAAAWVP